MYEASCRYIGFFIGLYEYQACSVDLKMDVYMHRLQESRSQSRDYRSTEFVVMTSLRRSTVCTSVIVGYGVKMKDVFASQCNLRVVTFSFTFTKTSSIQDRLLLSSKSSSLSLYAWEMFEHWREKQFVSTSLEVFRHEVARTDLPRKNLNEKTSANTWSFISLANEALQVKKAVCWPAPFFFLLSVLVRSCRWPICRELTDISRDDDTMWPVPINATYTWSWARNL